MVQDLVLLSISWGLLALIYRVLLQKETFFNANRAYLLVAALGTLILPFLPEWLPDTPYTPVQWLPLVTIGAENTAQFFSKSDTVWALLALVLYAVGFAFAGVRTFYGLYLLQRMIRRGTKTPLEKGLMLVHTTQIQMPVSFFHYILVPIDFQLDENVEHQAMFAHERAHARGRHSWDVLCMEVLCMVFWFHPLVHWYRRKIRLVHEYLADRAVTDQANRKQYGLLLLRQTDAPVQMALVNHFYQSPLKQRLWMLTRPPSARLRGLKFLAILPMGLLLWMLAAARLPDVVDNLDTLDTQPSFPGGQIALLQYLGKNTQYPEAARADGQEGVVVVQFEVGTNGQLYNFKALGKDVPSLRAEAIRVVQRMPLWSAGIRNGRPVRTSLSLPIKFKLN
jgi:TonB family protein